MRDVPRLPDHDRFRVSPPTGKKQFLNDGGEWLDLDDPYYFSDGLVALRRRESAAALAIEWFRTHGPAEESFPHENDWRIWYRAVKPEISLTPGDVGRRVRLQSGEIHTIIAYDGSPVIPFRLDNGWWVGSNGRSAANVPNNHIIEVLPPVCECARLKAQLAAIRDAAREV